MKFAQIIVLVALNIALAQNSKAQTENPELDNFLNKKMKNSGRIGMQAAYISDGELTWVGSYGIKTFQTSDKVNDSTLFMTASISKPVTALALMKLYDDGRLGLDDDINNYLPFEIRNPNYPDEIITFRMLLSHVSSIRDHWPTLEIGYTIDDGGDSPISLEDHLKSYLVTGGKYYDRENNFYDVVPGTQQRYSNVGYGLIGYLVQRISGRPFNEYMTEEIFTPLKMKNTYWFLSEISHHNLATPHNMPYKETDYKGTQVLKHFGYPGYPSGQLRTTVSDYAQIIKLFLSEGKVDGNPFMQKETIDEFLTVQFPEVDKWQAISWSYNEFENFIYNMIMPRVPSHTGLDPGMSTVVSFDPATKTAALIFSNSPTTTFRTEKIIYLDMVRRLFKEAKKQTEINIIN
jgi:CubicO group peptidase (beta-lactamase class C family)